MQLNNREEDVHSVNLTLSFSSNYVWRHVDAVDGINIFRALMRSAYSTKC